MRAESHATSRESLRRHLSAVDGSISNTPPDSQPPQPSSCYLNFMNLPDPGRSPRFPCSSPRRHEPPSESGINPGRFPRGAGIGRVHDRYIISRRQAHDRLKPDPVPERGHREPLRHDDAARGPACRPARAERRRTGRPGCAAWTSQASSPGVRVTGQNGRGSAKQAVPRTAPSARTLSAICP